MFDLPLLLETLPNRTSNFLLVKMKIQFSSIPVSIKVELSNRNTLRPFTSRRFRTRNFFWIGLRVKCSHAYVCFTKHLDTHIKATLPVIKLFRWKSGSVNVKTNSLSCFLELFQVKFLPFNPVMWGSKGWALANSVPNMRENFYGYQLTNRFCSFSFFLVKYDFL